MKPVIWFVVSVFVSGLLRFLELPYWVAIVPLVVLGGVMLSKSSILDGKFVFEKIESKEKEDDA